MATATGGLVFERTTLPNGVRLLTAPMPHVQSTSCFLMFSAGSRFETAETNGIAHFAEHMFFKGTERRPTSRDIAGEVDSIGGEFNAFTGKEYTGYYVKCAAEHAPVAFDVLVDMIRHSRFEAEEIEREKGVIIEEMNMYFDTPRDFMSGLYESAPVRRPAARLGHHRPQGDGARRDARDVPRLHRAVVPADPPRRGRRRRFEGDLLARVEELVSEFARASAGPRRGRAARVRRPARARTHQAVRPGARLVGVRSYPLVHPDRYVLQLLATVLGGGMSSRLFTEVRERRGLAYYVFGLNNSYTDAGSLYSQAGVDINRIDEAVETIVTELRRIADEPVPADELEKARNFTKGRFVLQLESPHGTIMFGLRREVLEGRAIEPTEALEGLDAVTAEDIPRVAQDVIARNALNLAVIGPFDDEERFEQLLGSAAASSARSFPMTSRSSGSGIAASAVCPSSRFRRYSASFPATRCARASAS